MAPRAALAWASLIPSLLVSMLVRPAGLARSEAAPPSWVAVLRATRFRPTATMSLPAVRVLGSLLL